ncbi:MAG: S9 family peptidase [Cyclobacteriaceae bacterium]|nr:S9 family peptidase [Cyclobacteriaceae bacterium]
MKNLLFAALCLMTSLTLAQSAWTPANMMSYKRLGAVAISQDGRHIAFTVADARMNADQSDFLTHVWVSTAGGPPAQWTFGDKSCNSPQFSPDGQYLSFRSSRDTEGASQLYRVRLTGGEAEQLTKETDNINDYAWSPDGKSIAFTMNDSAAVRIKKDKKEKTDWQVVDKFDNAQLFVLSLTKNKEGKYPVRQLTNGPYHVTGMAWSPDSQTIAFAHQDGSWANAWPSSNISTVSANGGPIKALVTDAGLDGGPVYSPDGLNIAYQTSRGDLDWASKQSYRVIPAQGGKPVDIAASYDESPTGGPWWSADGKNLLFTEGYHTSSHLYSVPSSGGGKPVKLSTHAKGLMSAMSVSRKGDIAYIFQDTETPAEVYAASVTAMQGKKISNVHGDFMVNQPVSKSEVISWKSKDGKYSIEGIVTYPQGYQKGKKVPLILNVHGGPAGVFTETYTGQSSPYPIQAFAANGYAVLRANPRGSSGYGTEFRRANHRDWGFNDYEDLMAGVDKLINDGVVHPDSLVVTGWSYGGYMTSMIVTKTNRFKAAMAGAPVTNLMSFNGTADIPDFLPSYFDKEFWDDPAVYAKHSAMFNIKNAVTPTLVIHGLNDERVPPEQGFQLHRALQRRGVPTQMVVYPRQPHGFQEPKFIQNVGDRTMGWFDQYMRKRVSPPKGTTLESKR